MLKTKDKTKKRSLRNRLIVIITATSIIPLLIVGIWGFKLASHSLQDRFFEQLDTLRENKKLQIENAFKGIQEDINFIASLDKIKDYIVEFTSIGLDNKDGFFSDDFRDAIKDYDPIIKKYAHQFDDLFLIEPNGTIVYSVKRSNDFTKNLFKDPYLIETKLAKAAAGAIEGREVFEDASSYLYAGNKPRLFFAAPVYDEAMHIQGVVAASISFDFINNIMGQRIGLGKTGDNYLVGEDKRMRSNSLTNSGISVEASFAPNSNIDINSVNTEPVINALKGDLGHKLTYNFNNKLVLSSYTTITLSDNTKWVLVVDIDEAEALQSAYHLRFVVFTLLLVTIIMVSILAFMTSTRIVEPIQKLSEWTMEVTKGNLSANIEIRSNDELEELADYFRDMTENLKATSLANEKQNWFKTGLSLLNDTLRGEHTIADISNHIISFLVPYLKGSVGAIYILSDEDNTLHMTGSYAFTRRKTIANSFKIGEGLVGQAALESKAISLSNIPPDYMNIASSLGETQPRGILIVPFLYQEKVLGVIEVASLDILKDDTIQFMTAACEQIGVAIYSIKSSENTRMLLEKTKSQADMLQSQKADLKLTNDELHNQTEALKQSETELQAKQEILENTNKELTAYSNMLEDQKKSISHQNEMLKKIQNEIEEKAREIEMATRYKSEFLANMSHELRTPLNSLLILSKQLADNKDKNLTDKQVEYAKTINTSGYDLLGLINDILDLAKVESGKLTANMEQFALIDELPGIINFTFLPVAHEKGIALDVNISEGVPKYIYTDAQRVKQIVKNLISNALKFTSQGGVTVNISRADEKDTKMLKVKRNDGVIAISVVDTGIGISKDKQGMIFEAFKQADGSISRKYGGTGLGLSICHEFANLLNGEIQVESSEGHGSTFTLYLPVGMSNPDTKSEGNKMPDTTIPRHEEHPKKKVVLFNSKIKEAAVKDYSKILSGKKVLIADDDPRNVFALSTVLEEYKINVVTARDGQEAIASLKREKHIDIILMDIMMPGMDGFETIKLIKEDKAFKDIPVIALTAKAMAGDDEICINAGANAYVKKPIDTDLLLDTMCKCINTNRGQLSGGRI